MSTRQPSRTPAEAFGAPAGDSSLPRSRRGLKTRSALLKAARETFERDGFLNAKVTDIAAAAGVATGSFYTYFPDKDAVFAGVLKEVQEEMLHPGVHDATQGDDPIAMIKQANRTYLQSYRRNAKLMKLLEQVATIDDGFREIRSQRSHAFHLRNAKAIRRLQQAGLADNSVDPLVASIALSAMVSRTAYGVFVLGTETVKFELLVDTLTQLWVNALKLSSDSD